MSSDSQPVIAAARRKASYLQYASAAPEFSNGKLALLAAVLIAAVSAAITLLVMR